MDWHVDMLVAATPLLLCGLVLGCTLRCFRCRAAPRRQRVHEVVMRASPLAAASDGPAPLMPVVTVGRREGAKGCLLALQPDVDVSDFVSEAGFYAMLEGTLRAALQAADVDPQHLHTARRGGGTCPPIVVAYPELIGGWLIALGGGPLLRRAARLEAAVALLILGNYKVWSSTKARVAAAWSARAAPVSAPGGADGDKRHPPRPPPNADLDAVFRMHAERVCDVYDACFSRLARDFGVTVVAGSVMLPAPYVSAEGRLRCSEHAAAPLHNASVVYAPSGRAHPHIARKQFPVGIELQYCVPGVDPAREAGDGSVPVYDTPAGRVAVSVCADSWFPQTYARLTRRHNGGGAGLSRDTGGGDGSGASSDGAAVDAIVVPANSPVNGGWSAPWSGYESAGVYGQPADVNAADVGSITAQEAWLRYSMPARASAAGIRVGVTPLLRGDVWGMGSDGRVLTLLDGEAGLGPDAAGASCVSVWIPASPRQ